MGEPARRPSILWIMTDEQRTDSLGCYGSPWARTPNLDRIAREGAVFRHAITPSPVCVPARTSLMTGQRPDETGVWYNVPPVGELPLLTAPFETAGYLTASFGKRHYASTNGGFQTEQAFELTEPVHYFAYADRYDESEYGVVKYPPEPYAWIFGGRYPEDASLTQEARATQLALDWLDTQPEGDPFFLRVSYNGPHTPVVPPSPFDTIVDEDAIHMPPETESLPNRLPHWLRDGLLPMADASRLTREQIRAMRRYYYGMVSFIDSQIGRLLTRLEETGRLDDTIIAFVSDHGTHLGDYGFVQKQTFYAPSAEVPYLFRWPSGITPGRVFENPVETRSLLPTLLHLCRLPHESAAGTCSVGESLRTETEPPPEPVFSELTLGSFNIFHDDRIVMVQARDEQRHWWKLSVCLDGRNAHGDDLDGELYDLTADPLERCNLFGLPEAAEVQTWLRGLVGRQLEE